MWGFGFFGDFCFLFFWGDLGSLFIVFEFFGGYVFGEIASGLDWEDVWVSWRVVFRFVVGFVRVWVGVFDFSLVVWFWESYIIFLSFSYGWENSGNFREDWVRIRIADRGFRFGRCREFIMFVGMVMMTVIIMGGCYCWGSVRGIFWDDNYKVYEFWI